MLYVLICFKHHDTPDLNSWNQVFSSEQSRDPLKPQMIWTGSLWVSDCADLVSADFLWTFRTNIQHLIHHNWNISTTNANSHFHVTEVPPVVSALHTQGNLEKVKVKNSRFCEPELLCRPTEDSFIHLFIQSFSIREQIYKWYVRVTSDDD